MGISAPSPQVAGLFALHLEDHAEERCDGVSLSLKIPHDLGNCDLSSEMCLFPYEISSEKLSSAFSLQLSPVSALPGFSTHFLRPCVGQVLSHVVFFLPPCDSGRNPIGS